MAKRDAKGPTGMNDAVHAAPALDWPFEMLRPGGSAVSPWVALHGPLVTSAQRAQFVVLRRAGARFVGVTSYLDFPRADPRDGLDYESVCEAWCHCFRTPQEHFTEAAPRALISASDFTDWSWVARSAGAVSPELAHDVVYVGATEPWQKGPKGWALAARCLPALHRALGLRVLVIGRADAEFPEQPGHTFRAALEWPALLGAIAGARLLFAPNANDPSPRVIAEALCLDRPVLARRDILGGWKYVTPYSGAFFADVGDVVYAATDLLASPIAPREVFRTNFGPELSTQRLASLLCPLDSTLNGIALRLSVAGPHRRRVA